MLNWVAEGWSNTTPAARLVEPIIRHLKEDHRMGRCHLKGEEGVRLQAALCVAGYNIRWLLLMIAKEGLGVFTSDRNGCDTADSALAEHDAGCLWVNSYSCSAGILLKVNTLGPTKAVLLLAGSVNAQ